MATQLNQLGARVTELPDGGNHRRFLPGTDVDSMRIIGLPWSQASHVPGTTTIHGAEAAAVSYNFVATLQQVCS